MAYNEIEVQGIQAEIGKLTSKRQELQDSFAASMADGDMGKLLDLGKQIQRVESEIETLEKRYAKATGEAVPNLKGIAARNLKDAVTAALEPNIESIRDFVRTIWSLQPEQKLRSVRLDFDANDVTAMPTIQLVGGFRENVKTAATGREDRKVTRWIVPGREAPVTRKTLIELYGPRYGQTVPFADMTPDDRLALSNAIAAGESFESVTS